MVLFIGGEGKKENGNCFGAELMGLGEGVCKKEMELGGRGEFLFFW